LERAIESEKEKGFCWKQGKEGHLYYRIPEKKGKQEKQNLYIIAWGKGRESFLRRKASVSLGKKGANPLIKRKVPLKRGRRGS